MCLKKSKLYTLLITLTVFISGTYAQTFEYGGIYYSIKGSSSYQTASVTKKASLYSGSVAIPTKVVYNGLSYDVTSISDGAFNKCTNLTSVEIPISVTSIGQFAFEHCTSLTEIEIPDNVTFIGQYAFRGCTGLTKINIPNGVTYINFNTFSSCKSLTNINIPPSVNTIGDYAFYMCTNLTSVNIPCNIPLGTGVRSIGDHAFASCTSLTNIEIPYSLSSIYKSAFDRCINLKSITLKYSTKPPSLGIDAFFYTSALTAIYVPDGAENNYKKASNWSEYSSIIQTYSGPFDYHTVIFDSQGGSEVALASVKKYTPVLQPELPTHPYYTFAGWYMEPECERQWFFDKIIAADITLYALWTTELGITVSPSTLQLEVGNSVTLSVVVTPSNTADKSVIWWSSNTDVATVSTDGVVTAHANGSTVISASTFDGMKLSHCIVYVTDPQPPQPETIAITGISVNPATLQLKSGYSSALTANITPSNATNQSILWASNNTSVATVSANGVVTANSSGEAIVSAITVENGLMAICNVNVTQYVSNENINTESLMAYPNPTNGKVTISGLTHGKIFHIYNQVGLLAATFVASEEKMTIDLSHLSSGIYFLKTETGTLKITIL